MEWRERATSKVDIDEFVVRIRFFALLKGSISVRQVFFLARLSLPLYFLFLPTLFLDAEIFIVLFGNGKSDV